jgi:hypothetical protein
MATMGTEIPLKDLLAPEAFKRENFSAHLYAPYSLKLFRRVYLYGHLSYDLWVMLEADPKVKTFNERIKPIPIAISSDTAANLSPDFISVDRDNHVEIHLINYELKPENNKMKLEAWEAYCLRTGFNLKSWSETDLRRNELELANLKKLLRFTTQIDQGLEYELERSIYSQLQTVRKIIFCKLVEQFPNSDEEVVKAHIAKLIIERKVYSDISFHSFSQLTELSAYHEFAKS